MLLCSCATENLVRPPLPPPIPFTQDTDHIYIQLRLENGKEIPVIVDTGSTSTVLDKSLEPLLGNCLGTQKADFPFFGERVLNVYRTPKLFLAGTPLLTDRRIFAVDLKMIQEDRPIMGMLGMDCLRNYCLQINFADHKIHFLDPDQPGIGSRAVKYLVKYKSYDGIPWIHGRFFGQSSARWEIDTGCTADIAPTPKPLREMQVQTSNHLVLFGHKNSTNGFPPEVFWFYPNIIFNQEACTNFMWTDAHGNNLIGLRFLSRHLTTLNFPKRTLYFEPGDAESLADTSNLTNFVGNSFGNAIYAFSTRATQFLADLAKKHQLPGLSENDRGTIAMNQILNGITNYPISVVFVAIKKKDKHQYHYTVSQPSQTSPVKLQRAWQTDAKGHLLQEYPVP